ncbi:MAG TPA: biotin/lipoyl-containing protein, partial [Gemmataceae bacterium]|nr:biotin/lipoyl-containing protein [Gemmataceae bacterium]
MASEIKLPELGENIEGGEVVDVKVAPGDQVRQGQPLLEVEAEKSTVEVPSPVAGRVTKILVKKGDHVQTGQPLLILDGNGAPAEAKPAEVKPATAPAARATTPPAQPTPPSKPAEAKT